MLRSHNSSEKIKFADYDNNIGDCRRHIVSTRTTVKLSFTDTLLIQTPHYYGQFSLSLGKENPYIFSKFTSLNMDTYGHFLWPPQCLYQRRLTVAQTATVA